MHIAVKLLCFQKGGVGAFEQMITNTQHNTGRRQEKQGALLCGNIFSWGKYFQQTECEIYYDSSNKRQQGSFTC